MKTLACSISSFSQLQTYHDTIILMSMILSYNLGILGLGISLFLASLYFLWIPFQGVKTMIDNLILRAPTPAQLLSINYQVRNGGYTEVQLTEKLELAKKLVKDLCDANGIEVPMVFCAYWINPFLPNEQKPYPVSYSLSFLTKIIIINPEALLQLTEAELKGVLAHELSHIKHADSNKFLAFDFLRGITTAVATFGLVRLFCSKVLTFSLWPFGLTQVSSAPQCYKHLFMEFVAVWFCAKAFSYLLMLVQNRIKRGLENRCDLEAIQMCGDVQGLLGFFEKSLLIMGNCYELEDSHPSHVARMNILKIWQAKNSNIATEQKEIFEVAESTKEEILEQVSTSEKDSSEENLHQENPTEVEQVSKIVTPKNKSKKSD